MSSSLILNRSLKRTRGCSQPGSVHTRVQMGVFTSCSPQPMALAAPAGPCEGVGNSCPRAALQVDVEQRSSRTTKADVVVPGARRPR